MKLHFTKSSDEGVRETCKGFSLIEVLIAIVILTVGLLALMAFMAKALATVHAVEDDQIAKQKSREALESIYAARNDSTISFDQIQNLTKGGIFKDGFQSLYLPGANGIPGTNSDTTILDRVILPGKNGTVETASRATAPAGDDVMLPLSNFQRQVLVGDVVEQDGSINLNMRKVTVTVRVRNSNGGTRDYVTSGYVSSYQ